MLAPRTTRTLRRRRSSPKVVPLLLAAAASLLPACRASDARPRERASEHLAATGALGPYSAAVVAGELVFVSGKIGPRAAAPDATAAAEDGFAAEVEGALDAIEADLARLGLDLGDVVSATVYLTDMARYAELNAVYARRVRAPYPARTCVAVAALPAAARVEIAVVARRR